MWTTKKVRKRDKLEERMKSAKTVPIGEWKNSAKLLFNNISYTHPALVAVIIVSSFQEKNCNGPKTFAYSHFWLHLNRQLLTPRNTSHQRKKKKKTLKSRSFVQLLSYLTLCKVKWAENTSRSASGIGVSWRLQSVINKIKQQQRKEYKILLFLYCTLFIYRFWS